MDKDLAKKKVCEAIDESSSDIMEHARDVWDNPELGFKERRTSKKVQEFFDRLNLNYETDLAITGVRADAPGRSHDVRVAILGELDAVISRDHPDANPETGAVHACGHHAQQAVMLATACGLLRSGIMEYLDGDVSFIAVPAEEYIELDYRNHLRKEGQLEFLGGKQELIRLGVLDDVDMAAMIHLNAETPERVIEVSPGSNGFLGKTVRYIGKEAHAGAAPYDGVNALNAAMLGLMGIHAQRETFRDGDAIRVHPIITKGGDMVNNVPSDVTIETYVRGKTVEAILDANKKVNRALEGGAHSIGAQVEINEIPGYLPLNADTKLNDLFADNARALLGSDAVQESEPSGGSTDMGDISQLMPAIHPYIGGVEGKSHARDFKVVDEDMAFITPGKTMAMMLVDLLWNGAAVAKDIREKHEPIYTKEEYLSMWRGLVSDEQTENY